MSKKEYVYFYPSRVNNRDGEEGYYYDIEGKPVGPFLSKKEAEAQRRHPIIYRLRLWLARLLEP